VHGYAIVEEMCTRSDGEFDLAEGTIYPALHRLEAAGLLSSSWRSSADVAGASTRSPIPVPPRSAKRIASWRTFRSAVDAVFAPIASQAQL